MQERFTVVMSLPAPPPCPIELCTVEKQFTKLQTAAILGISRATLDRERERGRIRCCKYGNLVRFTESHIRDYIRATERPRY
jgi:predicted DNA-binding transcriptional regulator AlpA